MDEVGPSGGVSVSFGLIGSLALVNPCLRTISQCLGISVPPISVSLVSGRGSRMSLPDSSLFGSHGEGPIEYPILSKK